MFAMRAFFACRALLIAAKPDGLRAGDTAELIGPTKVSAIWRRLPERYEILTALGGRYHRS